MFNGVHPVAVVPTSANPVNPERSEVGADLVADCLIAQLGRAHKVRTGPGSFLGLALCPLLGVAHIDSTSAFLVGANSGVLCE